MANQPKLPKKGQKPKGGGQSLLGNMLGSGSPSKKQHGGVHGTNRRGGGPRR